MLSKRRHQHGLPGLVMVAAIVAGCAGPSVERDKALTATECSAVAQAEPLIGRWMSVRRQAGVTGELKTFIELRPDGTMNYAEQLVRPGRLPQGLMETGCWHREGATLVLRTIESNGSPVDLEDPIYVNHYEVASEPGARLKLVAPDGARLDAKRMPPDYRLTW